MIQIVAEDLVDLSVAQLLQLPCVALSILNHISAFGLRHQELADVGRVPFKFFGITGDWKFHTQMFLLPQTYTF